MKIAFLNLYQGVVERGAETFVSELSQRLSKNHKVDIFTDKVRPCQRWPFVWKFFVDPQGLQIFWFTLRKLPKIWRERYDVVIPINGGWQSALVRLVTWLYGSKMIISGQSGMGWDDRNNIWSFPNAFVALSSRAERWANKVCPFVRVDYIPNGVDTQKFSPQGEVLKTGLKRPIVLCVAALTKVKRINLLIRAVARTEMGLLLVGDGELRKEIKVLGNKMLPGRFETTKLSFAELPKSYRAAEVFSLPSESYQSFEIVLVEAMSSGLPVVANDDPIRREIVGNAGILVDPTDTEAYAQALSDALKRNWGDKPRKQAEKFDWDKIAEKYENLIKSLFPQKKV